MATPDPTSTANGYNTDLPDAIARRSAILSELKNGPGGQGWGPNVSDQGRSVDLIAYRRTLLDELKMLNELIPILGGSWTIDEWR
jgi:hypothetical protein